MKGRQGEEALGLEALPMLLLTGSLLTAPREDVRYPLDTLPIFRRPLLRDAPGTEDFAIVPRVATSNLRGGFSQCSLLFNPLPTCVEI